MAPFVDPSAPQRNRLLTSRAPSSHDALLPLLEPVHLEQKQALAIANEPIRPTRLGARAITILAEAFELTTLDVTLDCETLETLPSVGFDQRVWLARRHGWDASLCVSYLATINWLVRKLPKSGEVRRDLPGVTEPKQV